ncbi:MAG TPA: acetylxylan esterase, partial [Gammaproteobacteria bacterium]
MRKNNTRRAIAASVVSGATIVAALLGSTVQAQPSGGVAVAAQWTTSQDHRDMQSQLGIHELRPGRNADASAPNAANYDEALANPFPILPDPLVAKSGEKITTAEAWWSVRRPQIIEDFEREVVGRVPAEVPVVSWSVVATREWKIAGKRVVGRQLVGIVDNSAYPNLGVEICMTLVTPAKAEHVPVMIMFGGGALPQEAIEPEQLPAVCRPSGRAGPPPGRPGPRRGRGGSPPPGAAEAPPAAADPPATEQLIAAGWGFAS